MTEPEQREGMLTTTGSSRSAASMPPRCLSRPGLPMSGFTTQAPPAGLSCAHLPALTPATGGFSRR